jgi:hypothetical protein
MTCSSDGSNQRLGSTLASHFKPGNGARPVRSPLATSGRRKKSKGSMCDEAVHFFLRPVGVVDSARRMKKARGVYEDLKMR